jgi:hypothetical protein
MNTFLGRFNSLGIVRHLSFILKWHHFNSWFCFRLQEKERFNLTDPRERPNVSHNPEQNVRAYWQ